VDPAPEGGGDLRRRLPARPGRAARRAQAARPLPAPLRPEPGRPLRRAAAYGRHRQAALQTGLPPVGLRGLDVRARAGDLTACATLALVPFSDTVDIFGTQVGLYGIDPSIGILYAFAFGGLAFYGLMLGGWASGSKYSFLGSMRAAAQLISYEIAQGLALIGVVMMAGSLSLTEIVEAQQGPGDLWYAIPQFVGFIIFLVAGFAETNRPPFDLPEADAELVQGYITEFGGGRFAAFFAAEYLNIIVVSALTATLFLGGWNVPFVDPPTWVDPIVVIVKTLALVFFFIWIRATLPRLRYDQLMSFGWKVFLPLATVNALVTAILVVVW
jgi:NADH-quinone oxidoreductase subunit H